MGLLSPGHAPRGVVALLTEFGHSDLLGDTETMAYQITFTAAPNRIYRVHFHAVAADTDGVGDNSARGAKNCMVARCRWASGSTVTTAGTLIGRNRTSVFVNDSLSATSVDFSSYLVNPPRGQLTVGISGQAGRSAASYGRVAFLGTDGSHFAVEDVGPFADI